MVYQPKWLVEAEALRAGTATMDPPRIGLRDWIEEAYGGKPISVFLHTSADGIVGTVSVISWDSSEAPKFRDGNPKYSSQAKAILDKADALGVFANVSGLSDAISVSVYLMRPYRAAQIIDGLPNDELVRAVAGLEIPSLTMIRIYVGAFRIFFGDDTLLRQYDTPEFKQKCRDLFSQVVKANDPNGYVLATPQVYLESQTSLDKQFNGNLYHFFK